MPTWYCSRSARFRYLGGSGNHLNTSLPSSPRKTSQVNLPTRNFILTLPVWKKRLKNPSVQIGGHPDCWWAGDSDSSVQLLDFVINCRIVSASNFGNFIAASRTWEAANSNNLVSSVSRSAEPT